MKSLTLQPITLIDGTASLPGSKSISNRVLLIAAMAVGTTILTNLSDGDDTYYMLNALKLLGVHCQLTNNSTHCYEVKGNGNILVSKHHQELFLGNSGTAMRLLTVALCLGNSDVTLNCEPRMKQRPINHLVDALRQGGAQIDYLEQEHYPPLSLFGKFVGGDILLDGSISSQFLTALLISAPLASCNTTITIKGNLVSKPYIDTTLNLMKTFGILVKHQAYKYFTILGNQKYRSPGNYFIEADASAASYFLAAAAIKGGTVKVTNIGRNSIQGDIYFANVLERMGAIINLGNNYISCTRNVLNAIDIDMNHVPDVAMTVAVTAIFAKGITTIRNIYNWRVKETDRLFAMATELRKTGAQVQEGKNFICITPPVTFLFAEINTYNDHRMAMCFSLLALSDKPVTILNPSCTKKTFPRYFEQLAKISL